MTQRTMLKVIQSENCKNACFEPAEKYDASAEIKNDLSSHTRAILTLRKYCSAFFNQYSDKGELHIDTHFQIKSLHKIFPEPHTHTHTHTHTQSRHHCFACSVQQHASGEIVHSAFDCQLALTSEQYIAKAIT